jgi:hypothetical protein
LIERDDVLGSAVPSNTLPEEPCGYGQDATVAPTCLDESKGVMDPFGVPSVAAGVRRVAQCGPIQMPKPARPLESASS